MQWDVVWKKSAIVFKIILSRLQAVYSKIRNKKPPQKCSCITIAVHSVEWTQFYIMLNVFWTYMFSIPSNSWLTRKLKSKSIYIMNNKSKLCVRQRNIHPNYLKRKKEWKKERRKRKQKRMNINKMKQLSGIKCESQSMCRRPSTKSTKTTWKWINEWNGIPFLGCNEIPSITLNILRIHAWHLLLNSQENVFHFSLTPGVFLFANYSSPIWL